MGAAAALAGCRSDEEPHGEAPTPSALPTPVYVPFEGVEPDLPGSREGVQPGFFSYPANPQQFSDGPPGDGGAVSLFTQGKQLMAKNRNKRWQQLDADLNVVTEWSTSTNSGYLAKLQVLSASGDFPDITQLIPMPQMPGVLDKYFTDLTPYLAGEEITKYPALAALPPSAWSPGTINGRIYGVAQPRTIAGRILSFRGDVLDQARIDADSVHSGEDFLDLCREVTDAERGVHAFGADPVAWIVPAVAEMMGAPNVWEERDGEFHSAYASDVYPEAVDVVRRMWDEGLIRPDSYSNPGSSGWWKAGNTALFLQEFSGWSRAGADPDIQQVGAIVLPKWDGGGAAPIHLSEGAYYGFCALRQADEARTDQLLRILNHFAAPFGTAEYVRLAWGVEGHNFTYDGTDPVASGASEEALPVAYLGSTSASILYSDDQDLVTAQHDHQSQTIPNGITNPALGLYSDADFNSGPRAYRPFKAGLDDIIQGRRTMADYASLLSAWQSTVGEKAKAEYETAFAGAQA